MYNFNEFDGELNGVIDWLTKELASIRTGRATVTLLDPVMVESYGAKVPVNQVGSISQEDPKTIKITPFDFNQSQTIEKAITDADLGVSVSNTSTGIRVIFPELTSERRENLIKQVGKKVEEAKISVRGKREALKKEFGKMKNDGEINEDEERSYESEMQKRVDSTNSKLEEMGKVKEEELKL